MKSKRIFRTLGGVIAMTALLLPISSQADVYWSLSLGQGVRIQHDYHPQRYQHYGDRHHYAKRHHVRKIYRHHSRREHHGYHGHYAYPRIYRHGAYPYGFIPRHRPYHW